MIETEESILLSKSERDSLVKRGYRFLKKLGEGSFARVYLGEFQLGADRTTYSKLACKIVDTKKAPPNYLCKFLYREVNILANCQHPHIISVHSIFERRDKFFIFMRFAERGDLFDLIHANGAITEIQAKIWIKQMALALQYLHTIGIAHRDLKCENILITSNYNVKLSDFGFARSVLDDNAENAWSETFCGSLSYAAPEILKGNPYRPIPADMWSFGIIIYVMLNRTLPFQADQLALLYRKQQSKNWKFRTRIKDLLSTGMKNLVEKLLEPDVLKRLVIDEVVRDPLFDIPWDEELKKCEERALKEAVLYKKRITESLNKGCIDSLNDVKANLGAQEGKCDEKLAEQKAESPDEQKSESPDKQKSESPDEQKSENSGEQEFKLGEIFDQTKKAILDDDPQNEDISLNGEKLINSDPSTVMQPVGKDESQGTSATKNDEKAGEEADKEDSMFTNSETKIIPLSKTFSDISNAKYTREFLEVK